MEVVDESGDDGTSTGDGETTDVVVTGTAGQRRDDEGCGCRSGAAPPWWMALWIPIGFARRRRRPSGG